MAIYREITENDIKNNPLHWINRSFCGYSLNVVKDNSNGSVLPNCTGMATGLFSLEHLLFNGERAFDAEEILIYDAQNFWWQVTEGNLKGKYKYGQQVKKGGLMVWNATNGLGHVCYALEDEKNGKVRVWQSNNSGQGGLYYQETLSNANGRWGYMSGYTYLGCIYPNCEWDEIVEPTDPDRSRNQVEVIYDNLRCRQEPSLNGYVYGFVKRGYYNVLDQKDNDGYTWYLIGQDQWIANAETIYHPKGIQVGDFVRINGEATVSKTMQTFAYNSVWKVTSVNGDNLILETEVVSKNQYRASTDAKNVEMI